MGRRKRHLKAWIESRNPASEYRPNGFDYEASDEELSATAGLELIVDLFIDKSLFIEVCKCLPNWVSNNSYNTEIFGRVLLSGFWVGYDFLDDLEHFRNNPLIVQKFGSVRIWVLTMGWPFVFFGLYTTHCVEPGSQNINQAVQKVKPSRWQEYNSSP